MNVFVVVLFGLSTTYAHQNIQNPTQFAQPQAQYGQVAQQGYGQPQMQQQYMQQPQMQQMHQPGMQQMQPGMQQMQPGMQQQIGHQANILDKSRTHDRAHIQEHLQEIIGSEGQDLSKMSEEELQFHYFKLHDNDDNNKLDGLELVKSLIHWHDYPNSNAFKKDVHRMTQESKHIQNQQQQHGQQAHTTHAPGTTKLFTDQELMSMIDPILQMDDKNGDGYIDYPEFVAAQKNRGF